MNVNGPGEGEVTINKFGYGKTSEIQVMVYRGNKILTFVAPGLFEMRILLFPT